MVSRGGAAAGSIAPCTGQKRIPLEAFIGITYAVASAAAILAMSKATGETEHLKDMLVGNILAVSRYEVIKTAGLYGCVGLFHFIFRRKFLAISLSANSSEQPDLNFRLWDFLFYASFGFVVTSSVAIRRSVAGVLLFDRAFGWSHALCRPHRHSPGNWVDDGNTRLGARLLFFGVLRPAHGSDHCLYVRRRACLHGRCEDTVFQGKES
jgi:hypothetical protein